MQTWSDFEHNATEAATDDLHSWDHVYAGG